MDKKKLLTQKEASEYLKSIHGIELKPSTLASWRSLGKGPKYIKKFSRVYYKKTDLDKFVKD